MSKRCGTNAFANAKSAVRKMGVLSTFAKVNTISVKRASGLFADRARLLYGVADTMNFFHAKLENCCRVDVAILVEIIFAIIATCVRLARCIKPPALVVMRALRFGCALEHECS